MNDLCKCCGRKLEVAFAGTKYCSSCAVHRRDVAHTIYKYQRRIKELENQLNIAKGIKNETS